MRAEDFYINVAEPWETLEQLEGKLKTINSFYDPKDPEGPDPDLDLQIAVIKKQIKFLKENYL